LGICGIIIPGDDMQGVIYRYTSPSGKIYVGQTLYLQRKRIDKHKYEAFTKHCETPFGHAIRKYGWEAIRATYTVIETVEAEDRKALKASAKPTETAKPTSSPKPTASPELDVERDEEEDYITIPDIEETPEPSEIPSPEPSKSPDDSEI
jgi:hypothetical protein